MSNPIITQNNPLRELTDLARLLSVRGSERTVDDGAHWARILAHIKDGQINGTAPDLLKDARQFLATLNHNGHMHTAIYTDQPHRRYLLLDPVGRPTQEFPWGRQGKQAAQIVQLDQEAPRALHLALRAQRRHPKLTGRAIRAAQIIANGGIKYKNDHHIVTSQRANSLPYRVTCEDGQVKCTCKDWRNGHAGKTPGAPTIAGQIVCKHALAVEIYKQLQKEGTT